VRRFGGGGGRSSCELGFQFFYLFGAETYIC
jgi:hypothetical protein